MPQIIEYIKNLDGDWSIVAGFVGEEPFLKINSDQKFEAASLYKVYVAIYAFSQVEKGNLDLNERVELFEENKLPGTGILKNLQSGLKLSYFDLISLMMQLSDNTAAKMMVNKLGIENINKFLESLGINDTCLISLEENKYDSGKTTALDMFNLLQKLATNQILNSENSRKLIEIMAKCQFDIGIKRNLSTITGDDKIIVANKEGSLDGNRHEVALVNIKDKNLIISILSNNTKDQSYSVDNENVLKIAEITKKIIDISLQ